MLAFTICTRKFVLDALQKGGGVLLDDRIVVSVMCSKFWCSNESDERTEIELWVLG